MGDMVPLGALMGGEELGIEEGETVGVMELLCGKLKPGRGQEEAGVQGIDKAGLPPGQ